MAYEALWDQWMTLSRDEEDLRQELLSIRHDPKALEDRFYQDLAFGTGGMRGIIGAGRNRMNIFTIRRAAAGLADHLLRDPDSRGKCVAIGYDSRKYSARFAKQTALVLAARGVKACLFEGLRPVPLLSFAVRQLDAAAGVVITASHNPPAYNGFKAYGQDGAQLSPEAADSVTRRIRALGFEDCQPMEEQAALDAGLLSYLGEPMDAKYNQMVLGLMVRPELARAHGDKLSIVYTPLHGAGNLPVRRALKEAGFTRVHVVPEQELPDPNFSTVNAPNPEDPAAFTLAIPLAQRLDATIILGTDPDCDRLGVCARDTQGAYRTLSGNQIGCLMLHHILDSLKKTGRLPENAAAVKSIVSTNLANAICEDYGVTLYEVLTGFKFVGEKIQQFEQTGSHTFLFGFEESYGYLTGTSVRDKDAVNAALMMAEAACACMAEGLTLFERLQQLYQRYGYYAEQTQAGDYPGKEGAETIRAIMKRMHGELPEHIGGLRVLAKRDYLRGEEMIDGQPYKLDFPPADVVYFKLEKGAWACVRPSGTEPKIKFYAGAMHRDSMEQAQRATKELLDAFVALGEG